MDASPATAPVATHQSGGLDMDVSPTAPIVAPISPKSPMRAVPSDANVQDGIVQVNPTASLEPKTPPPDQTATPGPATGSPTTGPGQGPTFQTSTLTQPPTTTQPAVNPADAPPPAEPISLDHPSVLDTATLKAGNTTVTLFGIDGVQGEAAQNLQGFLASTDNQVTCQAQASADFVCLMSDGTDVAQAALVNGAARARADAPDAYREQEAAAQAARRGIWASLPPPPATVQHPVVQDTATLVADNQSYVLDGLQGLGAPYAGQMQSYIAANGDSLSCSPQDTPGHFICVLGDGTDVAKLALVNGGAIVAPGAPDSYRVQQLEALNNHRGIWRNPPPALLTANVGAAPPVEFALVAGDDGADGIAYVGGVPEAVIGGEAVFLIYGGDAGWGYYDHGHHWREAPGRYRAHMEHYHPGGQGLRGYHDEAAVHGAGARPGEVHTAGLAAGHPGAVPAGAATGAHPGVAPTGHPGVAPSAVHPGVASGPVHSGVTPAAGHPGVAPAAHPGMVAGNTHSLVAPGAHSAAVGGGGFVHPGASPAGFHPGGGSAPAVHASSSGGSSKKK